MARRRKKNREKDKQKCTAYKSLFSPFLLLLLLLYIYSFSLSLNSMLCCTYLRCCTLLSYCGELDNRNKILKSNNNYILLLSLFSGCFSYFLVPYKELELNLKSFQFFQCADDKIFIKIKFYYKVQEMDHKIHTSLGTHMNILYRSLYLLRCTTQTHIKHFLLLLSLFLCCHKHMMQNMDRSCYLNVFKSQFTSVLKKFHKIYCSG